MTMPADVTIGRDTLLALLSIAWSDGKLSPAEAQGIRSAAEQLSLAQAELTLLEDALLRPVSLAEVETVHMNRLTRLFTYAVSCWVAELDGVLKKEEEETLALLGDRLGLSALARERAKTVALSMAREPAGNRYDLLKLRAKLSAGLSQIGDE